MPPTACKIMGINGDVQPLTNDAKTTRPVAKVSFDIKTLEIVSATQVRLSDAQIKNIQNNFEAQREKHALHVPAHLGGTLPKSIQEALCRAAAPSAIGSSLTCETGTTEQAPDKKK